MPHIMVEGPCTVRAYWDGFQARERRVGDTVMKAVAVFLGRNASGALVECAVAEGFLRQVFLAHLLQKDEGVLVRIFRGSYPEKTEGVRRCLGWIGEDLAGQDPTCRWGIETLGIPLPARPD